MADEWFYTRDGANRSGPVSTSEIQSLLKSGQLQPSDMVWKEGMANWAPASSLKALIPAPPANVKPAPPIEEVPRSRVRVEEEPMQVLPVSPPLSTAMILGILKWVALGLGGLFAFVAVFVESVHAVGLVGLAGVFAVTARMLQVEEQRTKR